MKLKAGFSIIGFFVVFMISSCTQQDDFPVLKGPYLGQKPPGVKAEIFAPNIISDEGYQQGCSGFMNEGSIFIFSPITPGTDWQYKTTYFMQLKEGRWTKPVIVPFNEVYPYNFTVAPDGKTLYFTSRRTADNPSKLLKKSNIWLVEFKDDGWSEPKMLTADVNTVEYGENYPSVSNRGNIYHSSGCPPSFGKGDIFLSEFAEVRHSEKQNLGEKINTEHSEDDPFIAPDESFLIFCSNRPEGYGSFDLYISFRNGNGTWSEAKNMGPQINTAGEEARPSITPDGKYLFFTRGNVNPDRRDIFWVDSKIIEEMKPDEFE